MAFKPVVSVVDLTTGLDYIATTATVVLRPFGVTPTGEINCSRLGASNKYQADSDIDEEKAYHIYVDIGGGFVKRGMVFDDNVGTDKSSFVESF